MSWLLVQLRPTVLALAPFSQMPHNGTLVKGCKVRTITQIPSNNSDSHIKGVRSRFRCSGLHLSHSSSLFGVTFGSTARSNLVSFFSLTISRTVLNIQYQHDLNGHYLSLNLSGLVTCSGQLNGLYKCEVRYIKKVLTYLSPTPSSLHLPLLFKYLAYTYIYPSQTVSKLIT